MSALETMFKLLSTSLIEVDCKYCLVAKDKVPYKLDGTKASPNLDTDFVSFEEIANSESLNDFAGIGISVKASKLCAIDVDHCFKIPNDFSSIDDRGRDIFNMFKNLAYIEYSFSGTGLRILFKTDMISDYEKLYYIKNSKTEIEYYQPINKARYVTITGSTLANNKIEYNSGILSTLKVFLDKYMIRPKKAPKTQNNELLDGPKTFEACMIEVKKRYFKDPNFQENWFKKAPGSGHDESERDFYLLSYIFTNITRDKALVKQIFEESPFFKSKDKKHVYKWNYNDFRYFEYLWDHIQ